MCCVQSLFFHRMCPSRLTACRVECRRPRNRSVQARREPPCHQPSSLPLCEWFLLSIACHCPCGRARQTPPANHDQRVLWTAGGHTWQRHASMSICQCSAAFQLVLRLDLARPIASMIRRRFQAQGGSENGLQSAQHPISESHTSRSVSYLQRFPRTVTEHPLS